MRTPFTPGRAVLTSLLFVLSLLLAPLTGGPAAAAPEPGAVYTLTNAADANAVIVFLRAADGSLTPAGAYPTGGRGTGAGTGSQGALAMSGGGRWLFAVNARSDDISVFRIENGRPSLVERVPSGGSRPISLTLHQRLLYVLNAGGDGNITAFAVGPHGALAPLADSTRGLGGTATDPAQVAFSPDGRVLVVTEKAANAIATYTVGNDGLATGPVVQPSSGAVPFGFDFGRRNLLIVSEASGGVSSYDVSRSGALDVVTGSAPTHQVAACWLVVTGDGRYAYTANAGSGSISGFRVDARGALRLLDADGRTGVTGDGSHPIDMALSRGSQFLYTVASGSGQIVGFAVGADGSLTPAGTVGGIPTSAAGLLAR